MAILSQGSQVFALAPTAADPEVLEVLSIACATAFTPGGNPADQIETTCLEDADRQYLPGLRTPASATLTVNFDPSEPSHVRMFELSQMNPPPTLSWALGWSDGPRNAVGENTALPTVGASGVVSGAVVTNGGTGYTTAPTVAFTGGGGSGATGTAVVAGGAVTGINITSGGSGYTTPPTITFTGGDGDDAAATAEVSDEPDFVLPETRTWFLFDGYLSDVPFDFASNSVVSSGATIQRTGPGVLVPKAAP